MLKIMIRRSQNAQYGLESHVTTRVYIPTIWACVDLC